MIHTDFAFYWSFACGAAAFFSAIGSAVAVIFSVYKVPLPNVFGNRMVHVRRLGEEEVHPVVLWEGAVVKDLLEVLGLQGGRWLTEDDRWSLVPPACPIKVFEDSGMAGSGKADDPYTVEVPDINKSLF